MAVPPPIRKSTKAHQTPIYLQDYACNTTATARPPSLPYDIANSLTYSHLDPSYQSYLMTISACHQEPTSFSQAVQDPAWRAAMDKEIVTLRRLTLGFLPHYHLVKVSLAVSGCIRSNLILMGLWKGTRHV